jgi:hypothetical protein
VLRFDEMIPGALRWPIRYEKIGQGVCSHRPPSPRVEIDPIGNGR